MDDGDALRSRRASGVAQLFEQVARRILERRDNDDLHATQWSALRYFSRAGRRTANVSGLSRYLGNTSGPSSRTAKSLVERGLLSVEPAPHDARSIVFVLTEKGRTCLERDPLFELSDVLDPLSPEQLARLSEALDIIYAQIGKKRGAP